MIKQHGLSLVELMVAILISSILILGVTELFSRTSASDQANTELARMQESGRLALEIIGQDARRAGYQGQGPGCASDDEKIGVALPDDAVSSNSATDVTFQYATPGSECNTDANLEQIIYTNANGGIQRNNDPILDDATMSVAFLPTGIPKTASSINIQITVSDSRQGSNNLSDRTFNATYELRNRL